MKKLVVLLFLLSTYTLSIAQPSKFIHVDQFGYLTTAEKVAVISNPQSGYNAADSYIPGSTIELRDFISDAMIYSGAPSIWNSGMTHSQSGDQGWWFDFSSVETSGTYYINDPSSNEKSGPFTISENPYAEVLNAALRAFYYNRCNDTKEIPFAESGWTDTDNFLNSGQDANCRYVNDRENAILEKDLSGGWFDAGDYNKYVTFAHSAVHNLLAAYEENSMIFGDDWNWPESGNGLPDLLDEIKWELDWLLKMSNADGTTHIKMGSISFSDNAEAPPSANVDPRYYGPICSAASIAVASMFSHAAKVFANEAGMQNYAQILQARAVACYDQFMVQFNASNLDFACDDGTIKAGDADRNEAEQKSMAIIASVYLYQLTGEPAYRDFVDAHYREVEPLSFPLAGPFWGPYQMEINEALLLYTTLPGATSLVSDTILLSASADVSNNWNEFYAFGDADLYRAHVPDWMYHWGSNLPKANTGNLCFLMMRYNVFPSANADLTKKAAEQLHYFHGVNPLGLVHLSNMYSLGGDRCANEIYHTWFNDGTDWDHAIHSTYGPAPGFLTGGPNQAFSVGSLSPPAGQPAQKSYLDFNTGFPQNSWEISEPAIYYQAAYIRLLANFVNLLNGTTPTGNLKAATSCIEIYPNPTGDFFHIKGILDRYKLEIYDAMGSLQAQIDHVGSEAIVDMTELPSGTYLLRIENHQDSNLCVQKILKE